MSVDIAKKKSSPSRVLLIDDEREDRDNARIELSPEYDILCADGYESGFEAIERESPAVVLLDIDLGKGGSGMDLLRRIRMLPYPPAVIMLTGDTRVNTVVEAIQDGAFHYLPKPLDRGQALNIIHLALMESRMRRTNEAMAQDLKALSGDLKASDPVMLAVLKLAEQVAESEAVILLTGETGTGKSLIGRRIHDLSPRENGPFVTITGPEIAKELAESTLFGHEKGAFTDATQMRKGALEQAEGGTLFLDEIGDCPQWLQPKLLRVLEEKRFQRLGGEKDLNADVRIICATNQDLRRLVEVGKFREDLFHRINVIEIPVPPLRERPGDILPIAEHFRKMFASQMKKEIFGITKAAADILREREWRGNVRVLRNAIERAVILCTGRRLDVIDLAENIPLTGARIKPHIDAKQRALERFYREYLAMGLQMAGGNVSRAATLCEMSRSAYHDLCNKYGVDPDSYRSDPD